MKDEYVLVDGRLGVVIGRKTHIHSLNGVKRYFDVRFGCGSVETIDADMHSITDLGEHKHMTGIDAMIQMVQYGKSIRKTDWAPNRFIQFSGNKVIDSITGAWSMDQIKWSGQWEFYNERCNFMQLFEKLGPGKYATTDAAPGTFKLSSFGEYLIMGDGMTVVATKVLARATYKIHIGG